MYPSDLTDGQWARLEALLEEPVGNRHAGGRPRKHSLRRVTDAVLYVVKTGCRWRQLPANFPPWQTVYRRFRAWRMRGTWERVTRALREQQRKAQGRNLAPTAAIIRFADRQDGLKRGRRGYDAGKKIKGRKRHIAVDIEGNLLAVIVHSTGIQDRVAARAVLMVAAATFASSPRSRSCSRMAATPARRAIGPNPPRRIWPTRSRWSSEPSYTGSRFCPSAGSRSEPLRG